MARRIKGDLDVENNLTLSSKTTSRAMEIDGSGNLEPSSTTSTELGHLSGVTSAIQSQIDGKIDSSEKGAANGVATLDGSGKLPASQLTVSAMEFNGNWNASTNSPSLTDGTGDTGDTYRVSVAGTQDLGSGSLTYEIGDWVYYDGAVWLKGDNIDQVTSVAGKTGAVTLDTDDVSEATNLYYTDERAQDAIGTILLDTASVNLTYDDGTPNISADVLPAGVDHDSLNNFVANEHIDHTSVTLTAGDGLSGGGDISANRTFDVDITNATDKATPVAADELLIADSAAAGAIKKADVASFSGAIDHDSTSNFVADEHVAHSGVSVVAGGDDGLSATNNDLSSNIGLSVDINGTTAEATADDADEILIYDSTAAALKKMTRANFLSGIGGSSAGDIDETSFAGANNQVTAANVTNFAFANGTVRSFSAHVSIQVDATADLFETYDIQGIQRGADWVITQESSGDDSLVVFSITSAGQIQYTSGNYAGFVSLDIKFRAITTSV